MPTSRGAEATPLVPAPPAVALDIAAKAGTAEAGARSNPSAGAIDIDDAVVSVASPTGEATTILSVPRLHIAPGERIGLAGPSGAGKSTFLWLVAGLVRPAAGRVSWNGRRIDDLSEAERDRWRRRNVGLVFQDFALVPELGPLENVLLPLRFSTFRLGAEDKARARALLESMDVPSRSRVAHLSRGEQQRVALARAILRRPPLLLADEPTASLDAENGHRAGDLLIEAARESGATLVVASHDEHLLARLDRVVRLDKGRPVTDAGP